MSGKRSSTAQQRRRKARRTAQIRQQEITIAVRQTGDTMNEPKFAEPTTTEPCPDCRERPRQGRDEVWNLHRPRRLSFPMTPGGQVKCETCGGLGYLELAVPRRDPYEEMNSTILARLFRQMGGGQGTPSSTA